MFAVKLYVLFELRNVFRVFVRIPAIDKNTRFPLLKECYEYPFRVKNVRIDNEINILINNNSVLFDYFLIRIIEGAIIGIILLFELIKLFKYSLKIFSRNPELEHVYQISLPVSRL